MKLVVVLPRLDMSPDQVKVVEWFKSEGETINFGDNLCDVQASRWMMAARVKSAKILADPNSRTRANSGYSPMACPACRGRGADASGKTCDDCLRYTLTAAESGILDQIVIGVGQVAGAGDTLATVRLDQGTHPETEPLPIMRIAVRLVDRAVR